MNKYKDKVFRYTVYITYIISFILFFIDIKAGILLLILNLISIFIWNNTNIGVKK